ncbi:MAG: hypothetical protein H5T86_06720, partial [Armatimonadetes bacterium]|nr:hypothetical protein [Armatimonadota bacterium]
MSARIFTIMMLALLVSAVMAGPKLSAFLPASNEIPGWQVDTKSDRGAY